VTTNHNTDNKGYKTCHGFCKAFLPSKSFGIGGLYRDRTAALNQTRAGDRGPTLNKPYNATLVELKKLATGRQKPRHASLIQAS